MLQVVAKVADEEESEKPKSGAGIFGWFAVAPQQPKVNILYGAAAQTAQLHVL